MCRRVVVVADIMRVVPAVHKAEDRLHSYLIQVRQWEQEERWGEEERGGGGAEGRTTAANCNSREMKDKTETTEREKANGEKKRGERL